MSGRIVRISVAPRGGLPKPEVPAAELTREGITGNAVANPRVHGGPDRAVCLYAEERIIALQKEGHPIMAGATGENVTVAGIDWASLAPGTRLRLGDHVLLEITSHAAPCRQIAGAFADGDSTRISEKRHPGWSRLYARVLEPGVIRTADPVRVLRPGGGT